MAERIDVAQLNIIFAGDTSDLTKDVTQATKVLRDAFGKMEDAADGAADGLDGVDKASDNLGGSATELNSKIQLVERGYDQLKQTIAGAIDLAELGAQSQRVEDRFDKFASTIGDADEVLAAFNRGSGDTVDKLTAMNAAGQLVQQGLVGTAAEMEKTVEFATRLGDQTASATDRIGAFSQLLRNQSIQLLDNFGISSGVVRKRITELQAATADLSREEAFRIAVFEQGQKSLDVLGARVDDNAAKMERAQAKLQNFRIEMGEQVVPIVAKGADIISRFDSSTLAMGAALVGTLSTVVKFSGGLGGLNKKLGVSPGQFAAVGAAAFALIAVYQQLRDVQNRLEEGQEQVNETLATWEASTAQAVAGGAEMNDVVTDMAAKVNKANEALHANAEGGFFLRDAIKDAGTALVRTAKETDVMTEAANSAKDAIVSQADSVENANTLIRLYNSEIDNSKARIEELTQVQFKAIENQEKMNDAQAGFLALSGDARGLRDAMSAGLDDLVEVQEKAVEITAQLEEKTVAVGDAFEIAAGGVDDMGRSFEMVEVLLGRVSQAELKVKDDLELLGRAFSLGAIGADEMATKLQDAEQGVLDLTFAERKALSETSDAIVAARQAHTQALEDEKKALEDSRQAELDRIETQQQAIQSQLAQAEALKGADEQAVARAAIKELEKAQQAGLITFDDYTQAVVEIQDRFGLADDESRALTLGLGSLVDEFISGGFAANEFDDALGLLITDAKDGIVEFEKLKQTIKDVGSATQETARVFNAATGQFETAAMGGSGGGTFNAATGQFEDGGGQGQQGMQTIDGLTGQVVSAPQQMPASGGVNIYGGLHLDGVQNVEDFLAQLQALTPLG